MVYGSLLWSMCEEKSLCSIQKAYHLASAAPGSYLLAIDILGVFFEGAKIAENGEMALKKAQIREKEKTDITAGLFLN